MNDFTVFRDKTGAWVAIRIRPPIVDRIVVVPANLADSSVECRLRAHSEANRIFAEKEHQDD